MGIGMLLFWGLIIAAIVVLARGFDAAPGGSEPKPRELPKSGGVEGS